MARTAKEILRLIHERMREKWPAMLERKDAVPVFTLAVVQNEGPTEGEPVVCMVDSDDKETLARMLILVGEKLLEGLRNGDIQRTGDGDRDLRF